MSEDAVARRTLSLEVLIGLAILAAAGVSLVAAPGPAGALGAALAVLMGAIAAVDARRFLIPDALTACAFALALVQAGIFGAPFALEAAAYAVLRGATAALAFLALREAYRRLRGREGIGLGDVKLAGVAGAWLDPMTLLIAIEIAALAALAAYGIRQFVSGRAMRRMSRLPFGLYLAPAIWLGWLFETWLLR